MYPYLPLGPFLIQLPGLALLLGLWLGLSLADREARKLRVNTADLSNLVFFGLVAGLVVFAIVRQRPLKKPGAGLNFLTFISLAAASRLFLEAFRGDSLLLATGLRAVQIIALTLLLASLGLMRSWATQQMNDT